MPVRQWHEERRLVQAEMQRLRDKLAISDRTAKAEAQLKDKLKLRLKTLEESLRNLSIAGENTSPIPGTVKLEKPNRILRFLTNNGGLKKRSTSQPRVSAIRGSPSRQPSLDAEGDSSGDNTPDGEDVVSGFLYDRLQKEVIRLRKSSDVKDTVLNAKDQEIQILVKKVDALTKAVKVESRKARREAADHFRLNMQF